MQNAAVETTYRTQRSRIGRALLAFAIGVCLAAGLYATSLYDYLLFHTAIELFSICVAVAMFMIAWNTRHVQQNGYLAFLGVAYLFVAGIDLVHALAYKGMGLLPEAGGNTATQLWIQARYLEALTLVIAPTFLRRRFKLLSEWALASYAAVFVLLLASIFAWHAFPTAYVEGTGLTLFKKASEYAISFLLLVALIRLVRRRDAFDRRVATWLFASVALTIGSELCFTFYVGVYDLSNLIGHLLKLASFYLIYRGIVETGLRDPYAILLRDLKRNEAALQTLNRELEGRVQARTADLAAANGQLRLEIEERHRTEEGIRRLNVVLRAIRNVNQLIIRAKEPDQLLTAACSSLVEKRGYAASWIVLTDEEGRTTSQAQQGLKHSFDRFAAQITAEGAPPCLRRAAGSAGPVVVDALDGICGACALEPPPDAAKKMVIHLGDARRRYGLLGVALPSGLSVDAEEQDLLSEMAGDIAYALRNLDVEAERRHAVEALRNSLQGTIESVAAIAESRDPYTAGHQERVSRLATAIGKEIGLAPERLEALRIASLLHDIGKVSIPSEILTKPTRLSPVEAQLIRGHPETGYEILKTIPFPWPVAQFILQHHERLDGSGYPRGLHDREILLEARIMAVSDAVEAMSSHRPYRPALGIEHALSDIEKNRGVLYDAEAVDACLALFRQKGFSLTSDDDPPGGPSVGARTR